jgi:hypothetical protein
LGTAVSETKDCKKPALDKSDYRAAAKVIYDGVHGDSKNVENLVPSLLASLPEWKKIG